MSKRYIKLFIFLSILCYFSITFYVHAEDIHILKFLGNNYNIPNNVQVYNLDNNLNNKNQCIQTDKNTLYISYKQDAYIQMCRTDVIAKKNLFVLLKPQVKELKTYKYTDNIYQLNYKNISIYGNNYIFLNKLNLKNNELNKKSGLEYSLKYANKQNINLNTLDDSQQGNNKYFYGTGKVFDICEAPTIDQINALPNDKYVAAASYISGENRGCANINLSSEYYSQLAKKFAIVPIYVGLQSPCIKNEKGNIDVINPKNAYIEGKLAAQSAAGTAEFYNLANGSTIYYDMEANASNGDICSNAIRSFISAWSDTLRQYGYHAGFYSSADSWIRDIVDASVSGNILSDAKLACTNDNKDNCVQVNDKTQFAAPDSIWFARWDKQDTLKDNSINDQYFADHQRAKQYDHELDETFGDKTLKIDIDNWDGGVGLVNDIDTPNIGKK